MDLLIDLKTTLLVGHIVGVALGAGGATMSDILFLTSIHDNRIDPSEYKLLKVASKVVVLGLVLLTLTGGAFFLVGNTPNQRFWAKLTIVAIAAINGFIMHRKLFPLFEKCCQEEIPILSETFLAHIRLVVSAGAISAASWNTALLLGMWRSLALSYGEIMAWYLGGLAVLLVGANLTITIVGFWLRSSHWLSQGIDPDNASVEVGAVLEQVYS